MENMKDYEQKPLVNELTQGKELVNELRFHLSPDSSTGEILLERVLSTINNALKMLTNKASEVEVEPQPSRMNLHMIESPQSGSPISDDSDTRDAQKRRKLMPRWTEQVRVTTGTAPDGAQEDGHSWRKYGQKDILGAKYPRGYYRCTHRHVQGCLATKQVQRSDEDPLVFDVTYRGKHSCNQANLLLLQASQSPGKQEIKPNQDQLLEQRKRKQSVDLLKKFKSELTVKTENQDIRGQKQRQISSPFSFPSTTPVDNINIFSSMPLDNTYEPSFSSFISPTTPESSYFSPCHMNIGTTSNFSTSDCDLADIISATTSTSNSPVIYNDFTLDSFDPSFPFDNPNFFS